VKGTPRSLRGPTTGPSLALTLLVTLTVLLALLTSGCTVSKLKMEFEGMSVGSTNSSLFRPNSNTRD
jgi:hypothetical protein